MTGGDAGRTVVATLPLARSQLIPAALLEFGNEFPRHAIAILDGAYDHLLSALRHGEADFIIGALRNPRPVSDVVQEHLFDDPLALIVRAGHPLAKRKRVTLSALAGFGWIAPLPGTPLRTHFDALSRTVGNPPPQRPIECNSMMAARAMLLQSDRVMLLSAHQIDYERRAGLLVALPHPAGQVMRPIGLTMRKDWYPTAAQQRLLQIVRKAAAMKLGD